MSPKQLSRRMSAEDAWFLYFEKPNAPLHIGSVAIYEGAVDFEKLRTSINDRMHLIPRYRQRAVIPPFYAGHPTWEDDPSFSIDRHLKRVDLPAPGTREQLFDTASAMFAEMLPRDRPLWDITVVGLETGDTAYISRVHHCLVDGVSGIELLLAVLDLVPDPQPITPEPWEPKAPPDRLTSWADALFDQWSSNVRAATEWQERLLDPRGMMRQASDFARALEVAIPTSLRRPAPLPWNKPVTDQRRTVVTSMSFQEVRGIRSALGGTVNDVVLTILGGALRRYLERRGESADARSVRIMIPVNVRKEDERGNLGNRVSMMLPEVPLGITHPVERLEAVREQMERLKGENQSSAFEQFISLAENIPAVFHALAGMGGVPGGQTNLVCTNVPGPLIPLYSVGHRLLEHYPLVPLAGDLGIGVAITSFDKSLFFGLMYDPTIVEDAGVIKEHIDEEFRILRAAAGVQPSDLPPIGLQSPNGHAEAVQVPEELRAPAPTEAPVSAP